MKPSFVKVYGRTDPAKQEARDLEEFSCIIIDPPPAINLHSEIWKYIYQQIEVTGFSEVDGRQVPNEIKFHVRKLVKIVPPKRKRKLPAKSANPKKFVNEQGD